jgi:putative protein kinase ArgK-like GTPase of G3E family
VSYRHKVYTTISDEELRGLTFLIDSFGEHLKEDRGTGDEADDRAARAAAKWIWKMQKYAYAHPIRRKAGT